MEYRFLGESTKNENATFPYKTSLLEANVKTNRMGSKKWAYHKKRRFAINYFIFSKILFQLRASDKKLIWCTNHPNFHIHNFESVEVLFEGVFSLWVCLKDQ